jgi:hypothetical protein
VGAQRRRRPRRLQGAELLARAVSEPGFGAAAATDFVYGLGCCVQRFKLSAPSEDKVVAEIDFVGTNFTDPSTTRATGAEHANAAVRYRSVHDGRPDPPAARRQRRRDRHQHRHPRLDAEINNNVKAQVQQGTLGAVRMIFGKFQVKLDLTIIAIQDDVCKAIRDNRTGVFDVALASAQGAVMSSTCRR